MRSWNRRELIKLAALSGLGLSGVEQLLGSLPPGAGLPANTWAEDTFTLLRNRPFFTGFNLLAPSVAYGANDDETAVVVIKFMNLMHVPMIFKFPTYTGSAAYGKGWNTRFGVAATREALLAKGLDEPSDSARFAALKFNKWFATILSSGVDEGGKAMSFLGDGETGEFPGEDDVAIQTAFHLNQQNTTLNHSFTNTTLATGPEGKGGDIGFHLARNGIIRSPLGITALNMGVAVETTDAIGTVGNRVVGSDLLKVVADGQTVERYTNLLAQSIGVGYIDDDLIEKFDKKTSADLEVRNAMRKARPELKKAIDRLKETAGIEKIAHGLEGLTGLANNQGALPAAQSEFLAQCTFVSRVLDIPGKPLRNFSLIVNVNDVDGSGVDAPGAEGVRVSYSYVEGCRQLAMGLNVLAHAIKKHKKLYVVVVTEGGRGFNMGDNKVGAAIILGPGGSKGLKDYTYADKKAIDNPTDTFCAEPNEGNAGAVNSPGLTTGGAGLREMSDEVLKSEDGTSVKGFASTAMLLHGLVKHLEERTGKDKTTAGLGNYVKIQKG